MRDMKKNINGLIIELASIGILTALLFVVNMVAMR
jgi:hypothetical protein